LSVFITIHSVYMSGLRTQLTLDFARSTLSLICVQIWEWI